MFSIEELQECVGEPWFRETFHICERALLFYRLGIEEKPFVNKVPYAALRFSQAVLASSFQWLDDDASSAIGLLSSAADIESAFALFAMSENRHDVASVHLLHASVLYDLAGLPGAAGSQARRNGMFPGIRSFFLREPNTIWGHLTDAVPEDAYVDQIPNSEGELENLFLTINQAIGETLTDFGVELQKLHDREIESPLKNFQFLGELSKKFSTEITSDLAFAITGAIKKRTNDALLDVLPKFSTLAPSTLRKMGVPSELWPSQRAALDEGILSHDIVSFGLASPTGTGKTASTRLLLLDFLDLNPGSIAFYIVPTRALTAQVANDLSSSLSAAGKKIISLGSHLTLADRIIEPDDEPDVIVFTPEKADLLLRVEPGLLPRVGLVIVDEAHHIEQGTRGILLEFYLWRIRQLLPASARIVQLSAVAPNIRELVDWLGPSSRTAYAKVDWRSGRLRLGLFERTRNGRGLIQFGEEAPYEIFGPGECPSDRQQNIVELAVHLGNQGIVLLLTTSTGKAESLAREIALLRSEVQSPTGPSIERLDSRIERELFAESPLRELVKARVAYHHSKLPPRVRSALESCIGAREIDIVCSTTTLAEGVNFPFSTVIVESLVGHSYELSPRALWNIAGRAGRFGVDAEGHCILFRPSGWENRLKYHRLNDYLSAKLDAIPPVRSALAVGIGDLEEVISKGELSSGDLEMVETSALKIGGKSTNLAKRIRGLVNVMRVGYTHAGTSGLLNLELDEAPEFEAGQLFAAKQLDEDKKKFACALASQQRRVVRSAVSADRELLEIASRIGWSLESQKSLFSWLKTCEDWQLEQYGNLVRGGRITDTSKLGYLLGPLANSMSEFEGDKLGGYTAYLARGWLEGWPLHLIRNSQRRRIDYARLVEMIYARIQYMLPWALFGCSELLDLEARRRGVRVGSGVSDLSALAAEGVRSFDALRLVTAFDVERVDANRLAEAYQRVRPGTEIVRWLSSLQWGEVAHIVSGTDGRRIDPDLRDIISQMGNNRR